MTLLIFLCCELNHIYMNVFTAVWSMDYGDGPKSFLCHKQQSFSKIRSGMALTVSYMAKVIL